MLMSSFSLASESTASTVATTTASRYRLTSSTTEADAQQSSRYTLRARFAPAESAGDLREGGGLALIGRFAKAGASCDANAVFFNGFEGS